MGFSVADPRPGHEGEVFAVRSLMTGEGIRWITQSLVTNMNMLTKVYFPRLVMPMTPVLAGLVDFAIAFVILGGLMAWYGITPSGGLVVLPLDLVDAVGLAHQTVVADQPLQSADPIRLFAVLAGVGIGDDAELHLRLQSTRDAARGRATASTQSSPRVSPTYAGRSSITI